MIRSSLLILILITQVVAQDYRWPIKASQSLSATFCEYRDGHLHAGIDIKTWGEMEVPCYAIADGYLERITVSHHGYGRGLFLRLNDGNLAVYGHLELFTPEIEALVKAEQKKQDRYAVRLTFDPDRFKVKAGQLIAYSGTSGTEHPHLHFEIRDSAKQVINPQLFYAGIKDNRQPVLDEIMLLPGHPDTRINNSQFPALIDVNDADEPITITGPFRLAINAHDRANGTLNKYNIYRAAAFVNDSLIYSYRFDRIPLWLTDSVAAVYPGAKGKYNWRFMAMFDAGLQTRLPFNPEGKNGMIIPEGVSTLKVSVADIHRNINSQEFLFKAQTNASWTLSEVDTHYVITRRYAGNHYERYRFYTGKNIYIPISQTYYRRHSTSWILPKSVSADGIRALGAYGGKVTWIVPPRQQPKPELRYSWVPRDTGFVLLLESTTPSIFPLSYHLSGNSIDETGELRQTSETTAESELVSLRTRGWTEKVELRIASSPLFTVRTKPLTVIPPSDSTEFHFNEFGISLKGFNTGEKDLYLDVDTLGSLFDEQMITGIRIGIVGPPGSQFFGTADFLHAVPGDKFSIFKPGKKDTWKRLEAEGYLTYTRLELTKGGEFFLIRDDRAPVVQAQRSYSHIKRGDRLLFTVTDNTGIIRYRDPSFLAKLDGEKFYPDYNPLRAELSFHIPKNMSAGKHRFEFMVSDASGNNTDFTYDFLVVR